MHHDTSDLLDVLLIEDNPADARLIQHYLNEVTSSPTDEDSEMTHVETLAQGLDHLSSESYNVVLLDLGLPDSEGFDSLHAVLDETETLPVVVLTGLDDDEVAMRAIREGAQDYLVKGTIDAELLRRSLRYAIERKASEVELKRQNDRLEEFASVISHDLRNPLNVAQGNLVLAREQHDGEHLVTVAQAHSRMETLIEDLLLLARHGQSVGDSQPINLKEIAQRAWRTVDTANASLELENELGSIQADNDRLIQLFENLFRNAIDHGGSDVTVRVSSIESGFAVEDDGPGIADADQERIFDRGFTTMEDGIGFGLAIVESIVNAHGWSINSTTGSDGGARFEITGVEFPE